MNDTTLKYARGQYYVEQSRRHDDVAVPIPQELADWLRCGGPVPLALDMSVGEFEELRDQFGLRRPGLPWTEST